MELKVGMYAYIKGESRDYGIGKIREIGTNGFAEKQVTIVFKHSTHSVEYSSVVGSYDITDLIEVRDYVNGDLVLSAGATMWDNDGNILDKKVYVNHNGCGLWLKEEQIKSIATKEQFESISYKVD